MNKKSMLKKFKPRFFGTTTIGEKGQVVIPAEIRKKLKLKKGVKLIVFARDQGMIGLSKVSSIEKFASQLSEVRHLIKKLNKHK